MTCPGCGAAVQPQDVFCKSCGRALVPADATRHLRDQSSPYEAAAAAEPAPDPDAYARPLPAPPAPPAPLASRRQWASGSSFPSANPYGGTPNTVSPGTILNGRPVGRRGGNGLLQGLGAGVVALLALLKAGGGALLAGGFGFFKLYFLINLLNWVFLGHWWLALIIVLLIVGAVTRARTV